MFYPQRFLLTREHINISEPERTSLRDLRVSLARCLHDCFLQILDMIDRFKCAQRIFLLLFLKVMFCFVF